MNVNGNANRNKNKTSNESASDNVQTKGNTQLKKIIQIAQSLPGLSHIGPQGDKTFKVTDWQISLKLVESNEMIRLNQVYRNKSQVTDILSFPAAEPFWGKGFLGDLVICLPVLQKQAKEMKHSTQIELQILLVHGLLHLLGFDHETSPKEAKVMAEWETKILQQLNDRKQNRQNPAKNSNRKSQSGIKLGLINRSYSV